MVKRLSENPYATPVTGTDQNHSYPAQNGGGWRYIPLKVLTILATIGLVTTVIVDVLVVGIDTAGGMMFDTFNDFDAAPSSGTESVLLIALSLFALMSLFIFIFNIVVICMFMYRANANVRSLGALGVENSPGWCGGYWFVPILQLFKPYGCMKEIHQASQKPSGQDWKSLSAHSLIGFWWGAWLIGNFVSNFVLRAEMSGAVGRETIWTANLVASVLMNAAAIMLIFIVRSVSSLQEGHAQRIGN
jgi:hypothetical protein